MAQEKDLVTDENRKTSVIVRMSERYGIAMKNFMTAMMGTALSQVHSKITQPQLIQFMIVADMYKLNPFTREIFAFADKQGNIVPVVSVDGWSRIMNDNREHDGIEFVYSDEITTPERGKPCPIWCEALIYRKDRAHPSRVREYLDEVYRPAFLKDGKTIDGPWQTHTKRMLRHKTMIQAGRVVYGFSNLYDEDEAMRIIEQRGRTLDGQSVEVYPTKTEAVAAAVDEKINPRPQEQQPVQQRAPDDDLELQDDFVMTLARELMEDGRVDEAMEKAREITDHAKREAMLKELSAGG